MNLEDEQLKTALATLLPRERRIVQLLSEGKSYERIGAAFGFSRAHAYRLTASATQKLRARLKAGANKPDRA